MTKEETLTYLKAYLDGDTAIGNIIPLRSVLESALEYLEPSLPPPPNVDEAAVQAHIRMEESGEEMSFLNTFKAGAEWMAGQGVSMQVTDDTEWSEVDLVVHKNVCEGSIIQIRKK